MKYISANDIFPEELLKEIQKYVHGEVVYIPNPEGIRKKWGEKSGNRSYLTERNKEIRQKLATGSTIEQLAIHYFLSHESIKKIIYSKS
ncbi:hypothetical protein Back11_57550 [Paenibacillus baekrokdamisoli]|uniref:Uncharacterized protein n=1 Tax=Paenibacillus baekrokdamisoli TaxID=1712516 RepID=A0A3G9IZS3_9BACL|nr:CD3324 family protein [Paenibacillus baekrokdamisoli]MBB3072852.1 Mor family transcriptional regulator [Paenibacillus baekrokdamisoli]BBH24410.1 hypothetical protein Back11_57550 [Paenibacillus baekrokdamisoli]